ncbi:GNAT family N-acetyltransferase [Allokutzneria sp. A3M-2-11 16]|uniref:GNAT family N-acetyltransferase n=1 Tax=Allokutzneria sp. A3M-2-11 16 TaxID=2962043 RepID=UPI0020B75178|nr:GNAT family N-acetyltransferase [Allokutzneria sp. A3M-2-11 16]MCP3805106.1 GNAT family N-acetyltransferase [Allokutzneria sp. A3M-2-11 16]
MEPNAIDAGACLLRRLSPDDRPVLVEAFADPEIRRWLPTRLPDLDAASAYLALRAREWARAERYSWALADPATDELLGEVALKNLDWTGRTARLECWTLPRARGRGLAVAAVGAATRFGFDELGLLEIGYGHGERNTASARVARKCGFRLSHRLPDEVVIDGVPETIVVWTVTRLATMA